MTSRVSVFVPLVAFLGLSLAGCSTPLPPPPEPDPMDQGSYVIGEADVLEIHVWDNPAITSTVPVRPDGRISIALLDDVQAAGLTPIELKEVITEALAEYVAAPDVTVKVRGVNSKIIYMIGEVARQGPIALNTDIRVLDALSAAGGFTNFADKSDVKILRKNAGQVDEYVFDYDDYIAGKAPGTNILLVPGDTVVVPD